MPEITVLVNKLNTLLKLKEWWFYLEKLPKLYATTLPEQFCRVQNGEEEPKTSGSGGFPVAVALIRTFGLSASQATN